MTIPTPDTLAQAFTDTATGYQAEVLGTTPDPALGQHIMLLAQRIAQRVSATDPRLKAFEPFTDTTGYVWLGDTVLESTHRKAHAEHWSFDRWLNALVEVAEATPPLTAEDLAACEREGAETDALGKAGFRPTVFVPGGGIISTRNPR